MDCRALGPADSIMSDPDAAFARRRTSGGSLLHPAHFNAIVNPGCISANRSYDECASRSRFTKRESFGTGCPTQTVPPACAGGSMNWLQ